MIVQPGRNRHAVVVVAGHIDHGKTSLVRSMTGIETDRLKEERDRGMSIVVGFAHKHFADETIDFVDVPGHEKFIKAMVSGASGATIALLVVSAMEGIRLQTIEHMELLRLLGIKYGIVAVTKCDLIPSFKERNVIRAEIAERMPTPFCNVTVPIFVSSKTGEGIIGLISAVRQLAHESRAELERPGLYLPVDRVFHAKGHGPVVTGTLRWGQISLDEQVQLWPGGSLCSVKAIEINGEAASTSSTGRRTALNLRGIRLQDIHAPSVITLPGDLRPTTYIDVDLQVLASAPKKVRRGHACSVHYGSLNANGRVFPLGDTELLPGSRGFAQIRFDEGIVVPCGERFVMRDLSPAATVGGGKVIDSYPCKHTTVDIGLLDRLRIMRNGTAEEKILIKLRDYGVVGGNVFEIANDLGLLPVELDPNSVAVIAGGGASLDCSIWSEVTHKTRCVLLSLQRSQKDVRGVSIEELRFQTDRKLTQEVFQAMLRELLAEHVVVVGNGKVWTSQFADPTLYTSVEKSIMAEIESEFRRGGMMPPDTDTVLKKDNRRRNIFQYLIASGTLISVRGLSGTRVIILHRTSHCEALEKLKTALSHGRGLTVSEIDTLLVTTRKFSIPFLEYLDSLGILSRQGNMRVLATGDSVTGQIDD